MKKLLSLLLAAMMALSLAACGGDTGDTGTNEDGTVTANPDWPNAGTINCVIGWSAGGTTDLIARKVASEMSIVTESNNNCTNVTGASGSIAAAQVMTSADGETAWGGMISAGKQYLWDRPSLIFIPGIAVMITVICFNILGDKRRDILDPSLKD